MAGVRYRVFPRTVLTSVITSFNFEPKVCFCHPTSITTRCCSLLRFFEECYVIIIILIGYKENQKIYRRQGVSNPLTQTKTHRVTVCIKDLTFPTFFLLKILRIYGKTAQKTRLAQS